MDAITTAAAEDQLDQALLNAAHGRQRDEREVEALEAPTRALLALLGEGDLAIASIKDDGYGGITFKLAEGEIGFHPEWLHSIRYEDTSKRWYKLRERIATPEEAVAAYRDEAVPATRKAAADEEERVRKMQERKERVIARDDAVIAAFQALPPEALATFKTVIDYLALAERIGVHDKGGSGPRGPFGGPPPVANAIAYRLRQVEKDGIGMREEAYASPYGWSRHDDMLD